ncbi:MAG: metal ABC transporter permease [Oscillospiraceae bacterium]|nr:metal ABC transporter permease [Oscillospiraceae bacterium]
MLDMVNEMLSMPFVVRALIVGVLVALCAALLGVSLVLKRYSMIGDGLSHVGFGTLAIALAFNVAPLQVSIPLVLLAAFLLLRLSENSKIKGDAAIALISSSALAVGVIIVAKAKGMPADLFNYMFGSILAMKTGDLYLSVAVSAVVLTLYVLFYNKIYAVTFDEKFAKATGTKTGLYNMLIALLTALVIVVGMRMMGAMLISSLIIFPALTSMRVFKSFKGVVICSAGLSAVCFIIGLVVSYAWDTPAGASIVVVNLAAFLVFFAVGFVNKALRHLCC